VIPASDFFQGYFTTALEPDEILTEIRWPAAASGTGAAFEEACRRHGDFAMVGAAASVRVVDGVIAEARLALLNMADTPVRARAAEAVLRGAKPADDTYRAAGDAATRDLSPPTDLHASANYRKHVGAVLVRRALETAVQRAGGN
jgi:carbon-monoxide dehydrogenase medium subunit